MSWQESTVSEQRERFVVQASAEGANLSALCRAFGISRPTGYKWLARAAEGKGPGLADRPSRPRASPGRTGPAMEAAVVALRDAHPAWGGRKLRRVLLRQGLAGVPAASTVTAILRRHGRLAPAARPTRDLVRFEATAPNALWQMDFLEAAGPGRPPVPILTVLDDHSRCCLAAVACPDRRRGTVRAALAALFARVGLPRRILADHGVPWGDAGAGGVTALRAWLWRLGVRLAHGRPRHPQTRGKVERLHRTIRAELPGLRLAADAAAAQALLDAWRPVYNHERPHDGVGGGVPADRWAPSPRPFPALLPEPAYAPGEVLRRVWDPGRLSFRGRTVFVGHGLVGQTVAVRPEPAPGRFGVWLGDLRVVVFDPPGPSGVSTPSPNG